MSLLIYIMFHKIIKCWMHYRDSINCLILQSGNKRLFQYLQMTNFMSSYLEDERGKIVNGFILVKEMDFGSSFFFLFYSYFLIASIIFFSFTITFYKLQSIFFLLTIFLSYPVLFFFILPLLHFFLSLMLIFYFLL